MNSRRDAFTASGDMATVVSESGSIHWVRTAHVELLLKAGFGADQRLLGDAPRGSGVNAVCGKDAVMAFLKGIGMEQYADVFVEEGADSLENIKLMTDDDLESMGIKRMHRRRAAHTRRLRVTTPVRDVPTSCVLRRAA